MKPIKVKDLTFTYDKDPILKDVGFAINQGEFVSIIGPNGSGKTTLLKHLAKLVPLSKEAVWINDQTLESFKQKDLAKVMSLVPQVNQFDYGFTVFDSVMMGRFPHVNSLRGESKHDIAMVEMALNRTDTYKFRDRAIDTLSGGERQRVVVARAIAQDANIMILDEPITYLDIHHQIDMIKLIHTYAKEDGKTVVAVLHDLNFALKFSDRVILLNEGQVLSMGQSDFVLTPENLKAAYNIEVKLIKENDKVVHILPVF